MVVAEASPSHPPQFFSSIMSKSNRGLSTCWHLLKCLEKKNVNMQMFKMLVLPFLFTPRSTQGSCVAPIITQMTLECGSCERAKWEGTFIPSEKCKRHTREGKIQNINPCSWRASMTFERISSYIGTILLKCKPSHINQTLHFMLKSHTLFNGVSQDATIIGAYM